MADDIACNNVKLKYPNKFADVNEIKHKLAKCSIRKLTDQQVTIHKKRKTLQKSQVDEGILTALKNDKLIQCQVQKVGHANDGFVVLVY